MQQTEHYKLNLIETSDTFSPNPLNENMEKVEDAIDDARAEARAGDGALDRRVIVLEGRRLVVGAYTGDGKFTQSVELGFTPIAVLLQHWGSLFCMAVTGVPYRGDGITITENGFIVSASYNSALNDSEKEYSFLAIK